MKSDGSAKRAFCYLADATIAFFIVLLSNKNGESYNVGNPICEISILDLAKRLVELFPRKKLTVEEIENTNTNYLISAVSRNCPDITKINDLGWWPKTSINDGFHKTILSYE